MRLYAETVFGGIIALRTFLFCGLILNVSIAHLNSSQFFIFIKKLFGLCRKEVRVRVSYRRIFLHGSQKILKLMKLSAWTILNMR